MRHLCLFCTAERQKCLQLQAATGPCWGLCTRHMNLPHFLEEVYAYGQWRIQGGLVMPPFLPEHKKFLNKNDPF